MRTGRMQRIARKSEGIEMSQAFPLISNANEKYCFQSPHRAPYVRGLHEPHLRIWITALTQSRCVYSGHASWSVSVWIHRITVHTLSYRSCTVYDLVSLSLNYELEIISEILCPNQIRCKWRAILWHYGLPLLVQRQSCTLGRLSRFHIFLCNM